jgi:RNA polymerase sigma factor for flagellar operon FliA
MSEVTRGPDRASEDHLDELWRRFKATEDQGAREGLILHFSPLVKFVAGRVASGLPSSVDRSDLISDGIFGLIDAIDKFDPERGVKFETYAINRIRGAILDELRALDWAPRSLRARARELDRSYSELEHRFQRPPTDEELAAHMDVPVEELQNTMAEVSSAGLVALDELLAPGRDSTTVGDLLPDPKGVDPAAAYQEEEVKRVLADAINRLVERDRLVLTLYYYEGLTLAEIGDVLGVTESRVCQIHTKSVMSLRHRMTEPAFHHG